MIMWALVVILSLLCVVMGFGVYRSLRKVELYEQTIVNFYNSISNILITMRELDSQQMFEKDDEVGSLFQEIVDTVGQLRVLVYGDINEKTKDIE